MDGARAAPCLADTAPGYIVGLPLSSAGIVAGSLLLVSGYKHSDTMQGMAKCAEAH
jgi:hypothetical protein